MRLKGRSRKFKEATACCLPDKSIGGSAAANTTRSDIKRTLKPEEVELRIAVRQPPCVLGCFSDLLALAVWKSWKSRICGKGAPLSGRAIQIQQDI
jgi:hypothetical protein